MNTAVDSDFVIRLAAHRPRVRRFCRLARNHRLCYSDGLMRVWYRNPDGIRGIAIAFHRDRPVGAAVAFKGVDDINLGVYVKPGFRRLGLGSQLFKRIFPRARKPIRVWTGETRDQFYSHAFELVDSKLRASNCVDQ